MKSVRFIAKVLFYLSRVAAITYILIAVYALVVVLLSLLVSASWVPINIDNGSFRIYFPLTKTTFLLGDYNASYLTINLLTIGFYGLFLWLLSGVFHAFKQERLFTKRGFQQLSRFYIVNLTIPLVILLLLATWGQEFQDILPITFLHMVIGVFAFFMAAIFKQGLLLQEEQDLMF